MSLQLSCDWALGIFYLLTHERCCHRRPTKPVNWTWHRSKAAKWCVDDAFLRSGLYRWADIISVCTVLSCWSGWQDRFSMLHRHIYGCLYIGYIQYHCSSAVSMLSVSSVYSHMSAAVSQTTDQTCQLDVAPFEGSQMVS